MNEVEAVKSKDDIQTINSLLRKHGGEIYSEIWSLGINTALRISDLLAIKMENLTSDALTLKESKTGKTRHITLNRPAQEVIRRRQQSYPSDTYLFQAKANRAASNKPIDRSTVARKFKEIGEIVKIPLGTHSMRKTRGYQMYRAGMQVEKICKVLNHSTPAVTLRYIGIEKQDIQDTYTDFEL
jgi:integrase